jgi:tRNA dimethylallyltransferase
MDRRLVVIAGPTGSGKSALALDIAETFNGEIVNCDSMQLYRGFDIGTAKTPSTERRRITHHLIDLLEASETYSAGEYSRTGRAVLNEIAARGRLPVVVGGTGFYLRALLEGLPPLPARDEALREKLAARERRRPGLLHRLLKRKDPSASRRIHPNDTQKLTRAVEVLVLTQKHLPESKSAEPLRDFRVLKLGLNPGRNLLHQKLDARVRAMFAGGLIDEVRRILARGATGEEKPFESLGYKQALQYIRGEVSIEQAITSTEIETRQYAKRQWTWFKRDSRIRWLHGFGDEPRIRNQAFAALTKFLQHSFVISRNQIHSDEYM